LIWAGRIERNQSEHVRRSVVKDEAEQIVKAQTSLSKGVPGIHGTVSRRGWKRGLPRLVARCEILVASPVLIF
jgi:hypothetical protein